MKTTLVSKENNEAKFTMEFTAEEFTDAVNAAYRKTRDQFRINGFRKGKAPRSIIEKHYGEGVFFEDAINSMFRDHYVGAIEELGLDVIDSPDADFSELGHGKPLTMTMTVKLFPIVDVKDYMGVEVEQYESEVMDAEIDNHLESLQKRNARMVSVEREAQNDDTVILDYAGFVGEDQFEGGTAERQELKLGSGSFIPGFEEQLVGAKAGDKVDVTVTFPEDYHAEDLAGKEAVFHCEIHEVKEEQLPELNDDFAMDVSEFDTLEELKEKTREDIRKTKDETSVNAAKDAVVNKVTEANDVEVPASLVDEEIQNIANELDQNLRMQGLSFDQYLQFTGKDMAGFREDVRDDAEKRAATRIILRSIAAAEGMEVSEEDVDAEMQKLADAYGMELENVKNALAGNMEAFKKDILTTKVIDMLYENAEVQKVAALATETEEVEKAADETAEDEKTE
jgi:trigger factor